jgi:membrane fusion protein (multidrug efflux system)
VTVSEILPQPVALRYQYAGRVAAFREVEVRARVPGILQQKSFTEGATVPEGAVLFRIDPAPYEAALARSKAQLQQAQAQVHSTQRDAERTTDLFAKGVGTEKARDDAVAAAELAKASVAVAEAQVETDQINLGYTTITAPIAGVTSLRILPEGSLVGTGPTDTLLTRISQLDPAYVYFSFTETDVNEIRRLVGQGDGPADGRLLARISFGDGASYNHPGYVDFTDSSVDLQTGTVQARAVVPNPDAGLSPGQFVRVSVEGITRPGTLVVPQAAVMQGPLGQFVYAIDREDKAAIRPITIGREVADGWIVESGLQGGDRIVIEGVIKVKPGGLVKSTPADDTATKVATQR